MHLSFHFFCLLDEEITKTLFIDSLFSLLYVCYSDINLNLQWIKEIG